MTLSDSPEVSVHYKLTGSQGQLLDSSENQEPLIYMHNTGSLLPALERELAGHVQGDIFQVLIKATEAYGEHFDELVQDMPLAAFDGQPLSIGMQFSAKGVDGQTQLVTVTEVHQNVVTVDANHPLAGEDLTFDVAVFDVREPTAEELQHGYVHSGSEDVQATSGQAGTGNDADLDSESERDPDDRHDE